jgi:cellulose synthase/poly-beta-1,6-N-acetylglucosamine synthase-like glycosyltransferase
MNKLSVIISVYNKNHELELILTALEHQSFHDFNVIIADDGSGMEMKEFIDKTKKQSKLKISHLWHEDIGFRKNKILNRAIRESKTDYMVFLDGDCLPHSDFMNEHYKNSADNTVLCGSRVNMSKKLSQMITAETIMSKEYEGGMLSKIIDSFRDRGIRSTYVEEGIYIGSNIIHKIMKRKPRLIGCNFSVPKELMLKINGFDENYTGPGVGEDSDIEFRLKLAGAQFESVRNKAIVYHFYHPHTKESKNNYSYFEKVKQRNSMLCQNGINKLDK